MNLDRTNTLGALRIFPVCLTGFVGRLCVLCNFSDCVTLMNQLIVAVLRPSQDGTMEVTEAKSLLILEQLACMANSH